MKQSLIATSSGMRESGDIAYSSAPMMNATEPFPALVRRESICPSLMLLIMMIMVTSEQGLAMHVTNVTWSSVQVLSSQNTDGTSSTVLMPASAIRNSPGLTFLTDT